DATPQSYEAYLRERASGPAAPAVRSSARLPWIIFVCALVLLIAAGTVAAVRFWDDLERLIAPPAEPTAQPAAQSGWERVIGGAGDDVGYAAVGTVDGGFVIAGSTESKGAGQTDLWLVRIDGAGTPLWEKTHGGA